MTSYFGLSDPGCLRQENEDRVLADGDLGLFVVADGMGGRRFGEMAAEIAVLTMRHYMESSRNRPDVTWPFGYDFNLSMNANRLATGIRLANRQVWKRSEEAPEMAGMGSTIAAVLLERGEAAIANVGDSRVYLVRAGELTQLTMDDTWLNAVMAAGVLDEAALASHPMRNVVTQAAGSRNDIEVHTRDIGVESGDMLLLSTDGLHGVIGDDAMRRTVAAGGTPEVIARRLIESARTAGGPDNIGCVVVCCEGP